MKPHKIYPYRRLDDIHIKNAMEVALEKYENELLKQENEKMKHREEL